MDIEIEINVSEKRVIGNISPFFSQGSVNVLHLLKKLKI